MISRVEWARNQYTQDPEFRERKLAHNRAYRRKFHEQINARVRQKRKSDPEFCERERARAKERWRRTAYGLTTEDYHRMLMEQNDACAICKQNSCVRLCVDHCHATGKVRGLLCHKCNSGLGLYNDDSNRLREAAAYVDASRGLPES